MKIQQIEYAIEVSKTLSFAKAAKNLFVAQPSISSAIQSLEKEIGFPIFLRTNRGVSITTKGMEFFHHAGAIINELKQIGAIKDEGKRYEFHLKITFNYSAASETFARLCSKYENMENLDFSISPGSIEGIIDDVYVNKTQLGIILLSKNGLSQVENKIKNKNLHLEIVNKFQIHINLREEHPILQKEPVDLQELFLYPFLDYELNIWSDYPEIMALGIINHNKIITANERDVRRQIVSSTNAFMVGAPLRKKTTENLKWKSLPLPGMYCYIAYIINDSASCSEETKEFIKILKENIQFNNKNSN